ncbi:MAG: hypothetical protein K2Y23_10010 [Cyanobacteria bacterium]|nr:hypothetical protein [Cyanobacteriota bacterium]
MGDDQRRVRALSLVALTLLVAAWVATRVGSGTRPSDRAASQPTAQGRVVLAYNLSAAGERGPRSSNGFDRIRVPAQTTEVQLSLMTSKPGPGERFDAELQSVDGGGAIPLPSPTVDPSSRGAMVSVTMPAPADGDYVLRLRLVAGASSQVVVTSAFRVSRIPLR